MIILTTIKRFFIKLLAILTLLLLVIQIPMINTFVTEGVINLYLPKGMSIRINRLQGLFPFDIKTSTLKFKDETSQSDKIWLQIENFQLSWRAVDFLYGNLHIENLSADAVTINSIPLHLITLDDDPIFLPYVNIDNLSVQSLKIPFMYTGILKAKAHLKSDFRDNHKIDINFYNADNLDLPALFSVGYTQKGADYLLKATSKQDIHAYHSLSPSVIDRISSGKVDLLLHLSGKSDFLEVDGSLDASLTNLSSSIPTLQTLVGSSLSTKIQINTKKMKNLREIIIKDGLLKTDKGLIATLDYQRTHHLEGKDHELSAHIHVPDSTEIGKNFVPAIPLSGGLTLTTHYDYKASGSHNASLSLSDARWSNSEITPIKINFIATPEAINLSATGGIFNHLNAQIKGDFIKTDGKFNGPLSCSLISSSLNLKIKGDLTHEAPLPWDATPLNTSPTFVLNEIFMDKNGKSLLSLTKHVSLIGTPHGFYEGITIPSAHLALFDGTISLEELHLGATPKGQVKFNSLSAQSIVTLVDDLLGDGDLLKDKTMEGVLSGNLLFTETSSSGTPYQAKFALENFGLLSALQKTSPFITVTLEATHSGDSLEWIGTFLDKKESSLKWLGKSTTTHLVPTVGDPTKYSLSGILNISVLKSFLPNSDKYGGSIDVQFQGEGPLSADPFSNLSGTLKTTNGSYENAPFGTIIKDISLLGNVKGSILSINTLNAKDLSKGSIEGQGTLNFSQLLSPLLDVNFNIENFLITNTDESTIMTSGKINISRKVSSEPILIGGALSVKGAMITLENGSAEPKTIRLYHNQEELEKKLDNLINAPTKDSKTQLDLNVTIPKNLFIEGFGLKSEWSGQLHLKGPANCPDIEGKLNSLSGHLDIANKHLILEKSDISFTKGRDERGNAEIVPLLNIKTSKVVGEYTAYLIISGSAYDSLFTFRSDPALSKEAVISLILFEKTLQNVTAAQTLQLATALASLNNKSFTGSAFNSLTNILGVDEISIAETEKKDQQDDIGEDQGGAYSLRIGKQLNDRIYLGIEQGIRETNETKAQLKIDVTKNTKVNIETGTEDSSIGYDWEMRY